MAETAFDTLRAAQEIEESGLDRKSAAAIAGAIRDSQGALSAKADSRALGGKIDARLTAMIWIAGIHFALTLCILAIVASALL